MKENPKIIDLDTVDVKNNNTKKSNAIIDLDGEPVGIATSKSQYDEGQVLSDNNTLENLNQQRGQIQPWYDKAANGVVNMAGRTVTSAAEGILNPFIGTFYAIKDGKASSYIDNPFTSLIDEADKQIKESVPFYQTKEEENAHGLSKLAYGNTYFRDVLDGVGFSLGAITTGGAYNKMINALGKTALVGKTGDFINKLNTIESAPDKLKYIVQVNTLNNVKDGAKKGLIAGFTATAESEMNARSDAKEFKTARIKEIIDSGRQPSAEELAQIDALSEEVLTSSFALNMPIIMLDNWIVFGKSVFGNKATDAINLRSIGEQVEKEGFDGAYKLAKKTKIDDILDKTYGVRKFTNPMISEGFFQEQSQYGITKGVNDYYKKKFYNPEAADFIESFGEGIYQAYGTKEGWDNGIIGALSGGAMGNITTLATQGTKGFSNPNLISSVPSQLAGLSTIKAYESLVNKAMRHGNLVNDQKRAIKNNDTYSYENAKNDDFINYASTKVAYGKTQDLLDELNEFKSMSEEEFKSNFGNELSTDEITKNKQTVSQFVQEKINKVQQVKRAYDIINERFPNISEGNKERLAYSSLTIDNAKERKAKLNNEAKALLTKNIHFDGALGDTNPLMLLGNNYLSLTKEQRKTYIKALLDANMNPMDLNETLDKFVDIDKLEKREQQFVNEYKELTKPHVQAANDVIDETSKKEIAKEISETEEESYKEGEPDYGDYEGGNPDLNDVLQPDDLVNKATSNKELDAILDQADKAGVTTPELIDEINKKRETVPPTSIITAKLNEDVIDEEPSSPENQGFPNTKTQKSLVYTPNQKREELAKTNSKLLNSAEVQILLDDLIKNNKDINDVAIIHVTEFNGEKSIEVLVGNKILFWIPATKGDYSKEIQDVINQITSDIPLSKSGLQLNISNGYIKEDNSAKSLADLNPSIIQTNDDYIIVDQGSDEYRAKNGAPILLRDAKGAVEAGITIPYNQRKLGRYILMFKEPKSGETKYAAIKPSKSDPIAYINSLVELANDIKSGIKGVGDYTPTEIKEKNDNINSKVFIALNSKELKGRNIYLDLNIDKKGDLRVNLVEVTYINNEAKDKIISSNTISNSDLQNNFSNPDGTYKSEELLKYIGELTAASKITFTADSIRNSVPKEDLTSKKQVEELFQTYVAPEVLEGQDVLISVNKTKASLNTIEEPKQVTEAKEEIVLPKEVDEFDVDTNIDPNTSPNDTPAFKLSDKQIDDLIDEKELSEVGRIIPQGIEIQTKKDLREIINNVNKDRTLYGAFKDKIIYLSTDTGSGVGYHEAFHAIFRMAISNDDVKRYLKLAEKEVLVKLNSTAKLKEALNTLRSSSTDYYELSDENLYALLLEEHMADRFMDWKKNKNLNTSTGLKQLFRRLFNVIKELFRINENLESFFTKIDEGAFSSTKAVPNNQMLVASKVYKNLIADSNGASMSSTKSKKIINTFAARIKSLSRNWEDSDKELPTIEVLLDDLIDERIDSLRNKAVPYIKTITDVVKRTKLTKAYKEEVYALENKLARQLLTDEVLKRLKMFDNTTEEEDGEGENNERGGEDGFGSKESWTISLEEGTNKVIKEYIAFAMYDVIDELTNETVSISVDSQVVYNGLGHVLANTPEEAMLPRFIKYAKDNVQAKAVLEMMASDTGMLIDYSKGEIVQSASHNLNDLRKIITAFKNVKVEFLFTGFEPDFSFETGTLLSNTVKVFNANLNTPSKISMSNWNGALYEIQKSNPFKTKAEKDAFWNTRFNKIKNTFIDGTNKEVVVSEKHIDELIVKVQKAFSDVGISLSSGYLRYSILSFKEKFNAISEDQLTDIAPFKLDVIPLDINIISGDKSGFSIHNFILNDRDVYGDTGPTGMSSKITTIAEANAIFDESLASSNFKGADGNTRHDIIKSSYVLDEVVRLRNKEYRNNLVEKYEILKDNILLKNDSLLAKLAINLIDGVRDQSKSNAEGVVYGDYSEREYLMQHIGFWMAQKNNKVNTLFRQNEASNTAYIAEMDVDVYTDENGAVNDKAINTVYNFFSSEYNRIKREKAKGFGNIKGVNTKASDRAFRFTEFSNLLNTLGPAKYNQITNSALANQELSEDLVKNVKEAIKKTLSNQIKEFKQILASNNLITLSEDKLTANKILPTLLGSKVLDKNELNNTLSELYLNDYINSYSLNQLFDGDYAISRDDKGGIDKYYTFENNELKESVESNKEAIKVIVPKQDLSIDIVKRNKGAMGSGSDLGTGVHTVAFIKSIKTFVNGSKDGQLIRDTTGEAIDSNDAQSYTNINHIIFMNTRLGRMSKDVKTILRKIRRGEVITAKEQSSLESAQASLNPWKTVTFGREFYIKTSEAVIPRHEVSYVTNKKEHDKLISELEAIEDVREPSKAELIEINKKLVKLYQPIPGKEYFHKMLNQMDIHGIDQIAAESASKGMTLVPQDSLSDDMDLSLSMIDIPNSYKRLQVETPTGKDVITAGTQLMQLIDSEQKDDIKINLNGVETSIGVIRNQYRTAMANTRDNSFKMAARYLTDGTNNANLQKKFIKALESSGADEQLLEIFKLNWNLLPAIDKAEQLFLAHFGSGILAQKVPGTKVSLMSDAHWNVIRDKSGKVILNKTVKGDTKRYSDKKRYTSGKLLHNTRDPKTGQMYSECVLSEKVFSKFNLKIGDEIPVDVATMLGYRIPTQDKHSMIALRVVDVLPNYLEGTGIFPAEIVLLSGADFDIDSMYIQQPSFLMKDGVAIKSGTEKTDDEKWLSFLNYINKNKLFKTQLEDARRNNTFYNLIVRTKKAKRTKEENEELASVNKTLELATLNYFQLPTTKEDYIKAISKGNVLNNDELNNNILDQQLGLLTNEAMKEIALVPVSSTSMENVANEILKLKEGANKALNSSSSLLGKIKANTQNSAGKAGIGPVANALQAFTFLAKNKISRNTENSLIINNQELVEFKYTDRADKRIAETLSTILSVMTDNAKDPIAGKMGLSLELLSPFNYLISLGLSLKDAALIINTPSVQMYGKFLKENKYAIKTATEKSGTRSAKLNDLFLELSQGQGLAPLEYNKGLKPNPINTLILEDVIKEGLNPENAELNLEVLITFLQIEEEVKAFQDLNNLIKLTKGLPTSFLDVDKGMYESLYNLGLNNEYGLPLRENEITPPFNVTEAVLSDSLLNKNIKLGLDVMKFSSGIFITETDAFKTEFNRLRMNLKSNLPKDEIKEIKRSFLGMITTKAYVKHMRTRANSPIANFNPANDQLLFPALGGDTFGKEVIALKSHKDDNIRNNSFVKWLKVDLNTNVANEGEVPVMIDKVSGKSFIKLSTESINDIVNSFQDLYNNVETQQSAINAFHYLITKDNLEYKNDSFVKYIAPFMFTSISNSLNQEIESLSKGWTTEFNETSNEFRKLLASYTENTGLYTNIKLDRVAPDEKNPQILVKNTFKKSYKYDLTNSEGHFEMKQTKDSILFKYPEYIILKINNVPGLYYNDLRGGVEDWSTSAEYIQLPLIGFKNITILNKDYNSNLNTYEALSQLKKEDKKGFSEELVDDGSSEGNPDLNDMFFEPADETTTKIPDQNPFGDIKEPGSEDKVDNNLDNSNKKTILPKGITEEDINNLPDC